MKKSYRVHKIAPENPMLTRTQRLVEESIPRETLDLWTARVDEEYPNIDRGPVSLTAAIVERTRGQALREFTYTNEAVGISELVHMTGRDIQVALTRQSLASKNTQESSVADSADGFQSIAEQFYTNELTRMYAVKQNLWSARNYLEVGRALKGRGQYDKEKFTRIELANWGDGDDVALWFTTNVMQHNNYLLATQEPTPKLTAWNRIHFEGLKKIHWLLQRDEEAGQLIEGGFY